MMTWKRTSIERNQCSHRARGDHSASKQRIADQRSISQTSHRSNPPRVRLLPIGSSRIVVQIAAQGPALEYETIVCSADRKRLVMILTIRFSRLAKYFREVAACTARRKS